MSPALDVRHLDVILEADGRRVPLVQDVSFQIGAGEIFGLVGESGSGKTMIAMALMRLLPAGAHATGEIRLEGREILALPEAEMRGIRGGRIGMVFQEPVSALNPAFTIGNQIKAAIRAHGGLGERQAELRAVELLEMMRIPDARRRLGYYPHQLSGGMCQRVMIAMAMAGGARLLVADEPTTSLDVTIQDQIVALLEQIVRESGISVLFISHDLGLVARLCGRIGVVYAGEIVESGVARDLLSAPLHPYTQRLVRCVPDLGEPGVLRGGIPGTAPLPGRWPGGCRFQARCEFAAAGCEQTQELRAAADDHVVRCWRAAA